MRRNCSALGAHRRWGLVRRRTHIRPVDIVAAFCCTKNENPFLDFVLGTCGTILVFYFELVSFAHLELGTVSVELL